MSEAAKKKMLGMVCIVLGAVFVLSGILLFFMSNRMNFQLKKTEATIVGAHDMTLGNGEHHTMLELSYRVGDNYMVSMYSFPGVLAEDVIALDIYYNIKDPEMVVMIEWSYEALLVVLLGLLILVPGLWLKGIINLDIFKPIEPSKNADKAARELYMAKKEIMEGILPMLAGVLFTVFGIVMLSKRHDWWCWCFIVVGIVELLYIGMEFVPALIMWFKLRNINKVKKKIKVQVYDVETDGELMQEQDTKPADVEQKDTTEE